MRGVVAAGHPLTAEAGARILAEGGNAVDAAVCAVLTSFAAESPLTGLGAGGFMLVHDPGSPGGTLLDFFVAAPGLGDVERRAELIPIEILFDQTPQVFNVGAASCGVPGVPAGIALALERFGTAPLEDLVLPGREAAWDGVPVNRQQAYILHLLEKILTLTDEGKALYAPAGRILAEGDAFRFPELADALDILGDEGPAPFYEGELAGAISGHVCGLGGSLSLEDLAAYEAVERAPAHASFRGTEVLTNPPPSSGGILIALCLELLERLGRAGVEETVAVMRLAQESRSAEFLAGLYEADFGEMFLDPERLDEHASRLREGGGGMPPAPAPGDTLGSTTHIAVLDAEGMCATVTCSNGTGSGVIVPGTGVHVNNMLGEEDLNPLGFHQTGPGRRMPSMMAPTIVLRDGEVWAGLGSAGSNRIRSAILQTILRLVVEGMPADEAVRSPRLHFEDGVVQAEPGLDEASLARLEDAGTPVARWARLNPYFGGVQAVARDPRGGLSGGGDPRRGGAVVVV